MGFHRFCTRTIICALLVGVTGIAGASSKTIESVKTMERALDVMIAPFDGLSLGSTSAQNRRIPENYISCGPLAISADGTAIAWCSAAYPYGDERNPFITVKTVKDSERRLWVQGRVAAGRIGISSTGDVMIAVARPTDPLQARRRELLLIDGFTLLGRPGTSL